MKIISVIVVIRIAARIIEMATLILIIMRRIRMRVDRRGTAHGRIIIPTTIATHTTDGTRTRGRMPNARMII